MRKTFTYLSLMIAMLLIGTTSAFAQFEGRVQQYPTDDYSTSPLTFSLTEVATALETDTATLAADLDSQAAKFLLSYEGETTDQYTANGMGFWMTNDGARATWGDGSTWFAETSWSVSNDALVIAIGQFPDAFTATTATNATYILQRADKEVTFKIGLDVYKPQIEGMADTINKAEVTTIVKEYTINVHQFPRATTNGDEVKIDVKEGLAALGITASDLAPNLPAALYTQYISDYSGAPMAVDSLHNTSSSGLTAPGWWFQPSMIDGGEEEAYTEEAFSFATSSGSKFYIHGFSLDAETDTLYSYIGQNSMVLEAGDSLTASVYLAYKGQAVKFNYQLVIDESTELPFDQMTQVGDTVISIQQYPRTDYSSDNMAINVAAIEAALGCGTGEYAVKVLAAEGVLSEQTTANNGGWWFNTDGYVAAYGSSSSCYIEPSSSYDFSSLNIGQFPNGMSVGYTQTYKIYFVFNGQYYLVAVNFELIEKPAVGEMEIVQKEALTVYLDPTHAEYAQPNTTTLDLEYIAQYIGEGDYTLYGYTAPVVDENGEETTPSTTTDAYSCTPHPGFWMDMNGYASVWGTNSYGMTYASGVITWYHQPGVRAEGDTYKSTFLFANGNKAISYDVTILFTTQEQVVAEVVGHEDVTVILGKEAITVDLAPAIAALGFSADEIYNGSFIGVRQTSATYTDDNDGGSYGWYLDDEGFWVDYNSEEAVMCNVSLLQEWDENNNLTFFADSPSGNGLADGVVVDTKVCIEYEAKQYIYNIKIMNEATASGIESVETNAKVAGNVYDLSGRLVRKNVTSANGLANGIYILNGKKYIVK